MVRAEEGSAAAISVNAARRSKRLCAAHLGQGCYRTACNGVQLPLRLPLGLKFGSSLMTYSFDPLSQAWSNWLLSSNVAPLAGSRKVCTPRMI